ncbi:MAG: SpoIID/LytB domain-containing protein [Calditrichaeota bacterium]|nr:MAG: SpoIID/LytB domain-containing protein [Calditrichota bacterium]
MGKDRLSPRLGIGFVLKSIAFVGTILLLQACASRLRTPPVGKPSAEPQIRVCIAENIQEGELAFQGEYLLRLEEAYYRLNEEIGPLRIFRQGDLLIIKNDRRYFQLMPGQLVVFRPVYPAHTFRWNGTPYSGELAIYFDESRLLVINTLPMESYLRGVVPFEIPTMQKEYKSAVYAQAIAARTYATYRLANPVDEFYDLKADHNDQVYQGLSRRSALADQAIVDTRGWILTRGEYPELTQYHSTCGGVLETSPDTAGVLAVPQGSVMYDQLEGEDNCKVSPLYRWVEIRDINTLLLNLAREFHIDSTRVMYWLENGFDLEVDVTGRSPGGRVTGLTFHLDDETYTAEGYRVRRVLANDHHEPLPGNFFFLRESPGHPEKLYIFGAGAGHGRGMCQWGAIGMALKGKSYQEILQFYYPNLKLTQAY